MKFLELVPMSHGGRIMPKKISRSGWAFALLAVLVPGISAAQPSGGRAASLHDGVVIDLAGGAAYVMSREGGIDAIQLSTGNVIWKSREAAKPLLVKDGILVAQAAPAKHGELVLATIDARRGVSRERVEVAIPSSLRANVLQGPSQSFETRAFLDKDGSTVVTWTATDGRSLQGMLPPEPEGAPVQSASGALAAQARSGAFRLEIGTGRVTPMAADAAKGLERASAAVISVRQTDPSAGVRELTSLDGKHVLKSERSVEGGLRTQYRWTVAEASGRVLGAVEAPVSMAPFLVSGSRVVYVAQPSARRAGEKVVDQPLRLVALDLGTGSESWTSPLLDPVYRGPFPP